MVDSVGEYGSSSMSDTSRRCRCSDSSLSLSNWLTSLMSSTSFSVLLGKRKWMMSYSIVVGLSKCTLFNMGVLCVELLRRSLYLPVNFGEPILGGIGLSISSISVSICTSDCRDVGLLNL